jgi:dienelactone hydrolase
MGTSLSFMGVPGVIRLPMGNIDVLISKPLKATNVGVLLMCEEDLSSPNTKRLADTVASRGFYVLVLQATSNASSAEDSSTPGHPKNIENIKAAVTELRSQGMLRVGVCGFGLGATLSLMFDSNVDCICGCYPSKYVDCTKIPLLPTLLILAGIDSELTHTDEMIISLEKSDLPTQVRLYKDQRRGFADKEQTVASAAAIEDVIGWFNVHLRPAAKKEPWRIGPFATL